jgi:hypothetical protein
MENLILAPPWFDLLNAMQKEWREIELEHGRNPDPYIERLLSENGRWPSKARPRRPN